MGCFIYKVLADNALSLFDGYNPVWSVLTHILIVNEEALLDIFESLLLHFYLIFIIDFLNILIITILLVKIILAL